MRYLITGGQGFIGSYLSTNLINEGHNVKTIGRSLENDIVVDLSKSVVKIDESFDYIIHTASIVHDKNHSEFINPISLIADINITENFLKCISETKFRKLIFLSSISVYGVIKGHQIDINHPTVPVSGYGLSKLINEKNITNIIPPKNLLILRLPLVNGPNAKGNIKRAKEALIKRKMVIFKNNPSKKSILEITDLLNFIKNDACKFSGLHQLKSFDILFNDFINSLSHSQPIILPLWTIKVLRKVFFIFKLNKLKTQLIKITNSLTIKNTT